MSNQRDTIIFYRSFFEAIKELPADNQAEIYSAIFEYSLNGVEISLKGLSKTIFTLIKPQLDANNKRFENGKKGGRKKAKDIQTETEKEPKENQTETENEPKKNQIETEIEANNNNNNNNNNNANENNKVFKEKKFLKFSNELLNDPEWVENILIKNKISISESYIISNYLKIFNSKLITELETKENKQDYAGHFSRWFTIELKKQEKELETPAILNTGNPNR